jgi:hypothetical protein
MVGWLLVAVYNFWLAASFVAVWELAFRMVTMSLNYSLYGAGQNIGLKHLQYVQ